MKKLLLCICFFSALSVYPSNPGIFSGDDSDTLLLYKEKLPITPKKQISTSLLDKLESKFSKLGKKPIKGTSIPELNSNYINQTYYLSDSITSQRTATTCPICIYNIVCVYSMSNQLLFGLKWYSKECLQLVNSQDYLIDLTDWISDIKMFDQTDTKSAFTFNCSIVYNPASFFFKYTNNKTKYRLAKSIQTYRCTSREFGKSIKVLQRQAAGMKEWNINMILKTIISLEKNISMVKVQPRELFNVDAQNLLIIN